MVVIFAAILAVAIAAPKPGLVNPILASPVYSSYSAPLAYSGYSAPVYSAPLTYSSGYNYGYGYSPLAYYWTPIIND